MEMLKLTFCLLAFVNGLPISESKWTTKGRIGIRFYTEGPTTYIQELLEEGMKMFHNEHYNRSLPLVVLIHGMDASVDCEFVGESVKAMYLKGVNKSFNIAALNFPELMVKQIVFDSSLYRTAVNSKIAGEAIGDFFNDALNQQLITPEQILVLGYSMGAQVAGYLARSIKQAHGLIRFILGLDPAGIGFTPNTFAAWYTGLQHVTAADAQFVHFLHCNSVGWGTFYHNATANFIFNGGNFQPGCKASSNLGCSHNRVPYYFIESILYPKKFVAKKCESSDDFATCRCSEETIQVTFPPDLKARGRYYLNTNAATPFGRGEAGVSCSEKNKIEERDDKESNEKEKLPSEKHERKPRRHVHHTKSKNISPVYHHRTLNDYQRMQQKTSLDTIQTENLDDNSKSKKITKENYVSLEKIMNKLHQNIVHNK